VVSTTAGSIAPEPSSVSPRLTTASPLCSPPLLNSSDDSVSVTCSPASYASPSAGGLSVTPTARWPRSGVTGEFDWM
jgi:hypothetical protein